MKLELASGKEAAVCAGIGAGGALVFVFLFPAGALSTLIHQVFKLPGPGAGIGLVLGPFLVVAVLLAALLCRRTGSALVTALAFAASHMLVAKLSGMSTSGKGAFDTPLFVAAVAAFGLVAEVSVLAARRTGPVWRCVLVGAVANASLLLLYWAAIFPRTAGWVHWADVPLLMGLCLAAGLAAGGLAYVLSKPLLRLFPLAQHGADYVRSPRL